MSFDPDQSTTNSQSIARGAIMRIRMRNFMTYDDTELKPGPNLNMILGPNGTGKSAVVCCIIVGLAGEVNLTGRGASPADFVKKTRDWGSTEIELFNNRGANYIIERKIIIQSRTQFKIEHKSEWRLNKKNVTKAEIQSITKKLNIKVDNLCQFLPQDSVTQFVKMNAKELLMNTLKAAGDNQLVEDHQKLVDFTKNVQEKQSTLEGLEKSCAENEANAQRLEGDVTLLRQREELIKQKQICNQKIHFARYTEARDESAAAREELNTIQGELTVNENNSEPYRRAVEHHKNEESRLYKLADESSNKVKSMSSLMQRCQNEIENRKVDCQQEFARFKSKQEEEASREGTIRLKQQELESLECKLNELRDVDCRRQIEQLELKMNELRQIQLKTYNEKKKYEDNFNEINEQISKVKRDKEQIEHVYERKKNVLKARFPDSHKVLDWLTNNRHRFEREVFAPIMCTINVKDPKFNRIVEHSIPRQELSAFICQSSSDVRTFTRSVRDELNLRFNVILAPEKSVEDFERQASQSQYLRNLNVKCVLKDLINAPDPIMSYLCDTHNFHRIPVTESCTESQLKQLLERCPRFYVGHQFYNVSKSRYDGQSMTVSDSVRDANFLLYSFDSKGLSDCKQLLNKLSEDLKNIKIKLNETIEKSNKDKSEWSQMSERVTQLNHKQNERQTLEGFIKRARTTIEKLKNERIDLEAEKVKLQQAIEKINKQTLTHLENLVKIHGDLVTLKKSQMINLLLSRLSEGNHHLAKKRYHNSQKDTARLKEELRRKQRQLDELKSVLTSCLKEAEEKIPGFNNGKLDAKTVKKFDKIEESTVEDLINRKDELSLRIQRIHAGAGNSILDDFNRQNQELREKRAKIAQLQTEIDHADSIRSEIKETWVPRLSEVIKVIDENYGKFMRKLSYDGQVKLDYDTNDADNFEAYGIMILVKYRDNEQLIPLSSTRQSGGERSVATMIYMLALQTRTTVPFRCVDEINQGMDKENERKVFELLVKTADSSSSQYFLVSPKLLSNLPYSEKMKIHVVFNGKNLKVAWNKLGVCA